MTEAEHIIATLRAHRAELEAMGVRHAALFGSRARGDARSDSDIDIALRLAPEAMPEGIRYFGKLADIEEKIGKLFFHTVEITDETMMRRKVRRFFERDKVDAF